MPALTPSPLRRLAAQKGREEHIPLKRGGEPKDERQILGKRHFDPSLDRLRGVVEGVFGAVRTRLWGSYLPAMLPQRAQKRVYLEAVAYNLCLLLRLLLHLLLPGPLSPAGSL